MLANYFGTSKPSKVEYSHSTKIRLANLAFLFRAPHRRDPARRAMSDVDTAAAEKNIELWKIKKLIKNLDLARG